MITRKVACSKEFYSELMSLLQPLERFSSQEGCLLLVTRDGRTILEFDYWLTKAHPTEGDGKNIDPKKE